MARFILGGKLTMVIDIYKAEKTIGRGDVVVAKHRFKTDKVLYYKLIEEGREGIYRLLNIGSNRIMCTFESKNPLDALDYIEIACNCRILDIIPSDKLQLVVGS